jgi:hydrogenase maturation protein HypF
VGRRRDGLIRRSVRVTGEVQGVGFRPFVRRLGRRGGLAGHVLNDAAGVRIEVEGSPADVEAFVAALTDRAPPLSRVNRVESAPLPLAGGDGFEILPSDRAGATTAAVTPDAHVCDACLREIFDPHDRRHRYAFSSCTECGPRYTIVTRVPYDRDGTTMAAFPMCEACRREYEDPDDRRFHAETVACPACGPRLRLLRPDGTAEDVRDVVDAARGRLRQGQVLAVKGAGGFHLAVDATSEAAVGALRRRKGRDGGKPFAIMVQDVTAAAALAWVDDHAARLLVHPSRPIVLLERRPGTSLAPSVAPRLDTVGLLLPSTPLHHLLLAAPAAPLVMTSGNRSGEPIVTDDDEAVTLLGPLVDALVVHDRAIRNGCDDSVVQVPDATGRRQTVRRGRGQVPRSVVPAGLSVPAGVLGVGAEAKASFCLTRLGMLVPGRHLGDLGTDASRRAYRLDLERLCDLLGVEVTHVAHDMHPDYFTTRLARDLALRTGAHAVPVQHHHAHLASVLVEADWCVDETVVGLVLDGTGYGGAGRVWGGEVLVGSLRAAESVAHLRPLPLPGGEAAVRAPWRAAVGALVDALGPAALALSLPPLRGRDERALSDLARLVESGVSCPWSSGLGRLFDVAAAILGLPGGLADPVRYDAQAAVELEAAARRASTHVTPRMALPAIEANARGEIDMRPIVGALADLALSGADSDASAAWFHDAVVAVAVDAACAAARAAGVSTVALSGGCFLNRILLHGVTRGLAARGIRTLRNERVSCGDGGLSLGQAAVACARMAPPRG